MASANEENMIVALDIGTSKVVAIVGAIGANGDLEIVGTGMHASSGLKKGVVVNIEATVNSIQRAIEEAELMAGCSIHSVYAGIAGSHIRSLNSHGIVAIRDREVQLAVHGGTQAAGPAAGVCPCARSRVDHRGFCSSTVSPVAQHYWARIGASLPPASFWCAVRAGGAPRSRRGLGARGHRAPPAATRQGAFPGTSASYCQVSDGQRGCASALVPRA